MTRRDLGLAAAGFAATVLLILASGAPSCAPVLASAHGGR